MSRPLWITVSLLFVAACSTTGGSGFRKQGPLLSLWVATEETSFGPRLAVHDQGLVTFEHGSGEIAAVVTKEDIAGLRRSLGQSAWRRPLAELQARDLSSVSDRPGILIQDLSGRREIEAFVPTRVLPDSLQPQLRTIDRLFDRIFGALYDLRLARSEGPALFEVPSARRPLEPQRLFLSLYVSGFADWALVSHLRAYESGLLVLSRQGSELVTTVAPPALAALRRIADDPEWQRQLTHLAATHDVTTMPEGDISIAIKSGLGDAVLWTRFPVEDMPQALRADLETIDEIFLAAFGARYPYFLSSFHVPGG